MKKGLKLLTTLGLVAAGTCWVFAADLDRRIAILPELIMQLPSAEENAGDLQPETRQEETPQDNAAQVEKKESTGTPTEEKSASEEEIQFRDAIQKLANLLDEQPDQMKPIIAQWQLRDFPEFNDRYEPFAFTLALSRKNPAALRHLERIWKEDPSMFTRSCNRCRGTGKFREAACRDCGGGGKLPNFRQIEIALQKNKKKLWKRLNTMLDRSTLYQEYADAVMDNVTAQTDHGSYRERIRILEQTIRRFPQAKNIAQARERLEQCKQEHSQKENKVEEAIQRAQTANTPGEKIAILHEIIRRFPDAENISLANKLSQEIQVQQAVNLAQQQKDSERAIKLLDAIIRAFPQAPNIAMAQTIRKEHYGKLAEERRKRRDEEKRQLRQRAAKAAAESWQDAHLTEKETSGWHPNSTSKEDRAFKRRLKKARAVFIEL